MIFSESKRKSTFFLGRHMQAAFATENDNPIFGGCVSFATGLLAAGFVRGLIGLYTACIKRK